MARVRGCFARPVWDPHSEELLWVDITAGLIHRGTLVARDDGSGLPDVLPRVLLALGHPVGAVAPCRSGALPAPPARRARWRVGRARREHRTTIQDDGAAGGDGVAGGDGPQLLIEVLEDARAEIGVPEVDDNRARRPGQIRARAREAQW
ncbi:SMP-30/gluconolactonase/LRE family protein [Streptomyces sp. NBC_00885]|uniref:hypothetical protein n=1 Tax=Streptomyces sp. NBC_00885 TaxID=2975857 RepID=UPI003870C0E1|nr:SMP-30/gluconolactonase/LRE family protein [Streptomyces sp. NBC_00885]